MNNSMSGGLFDDEDFDEVLPFALHDEATVLEQTGGGELNRIEGSGATVVPKDQSMISSPIVPSPIQFPVPMVTQSSSSSLFGANQPPLMMSSMISEGASSTMSSEPVSASVTAPWAAAGDDDVLLSSRNLDAAASLMLAGNDLHMTLAPPPQPQTSIQGCYPSETSTTTTSSYSQLGFSRLMQNAGDPQEPQRMPVLREEEDWEESFHSAHEDQPPSFPSNISSTTSQFIASDWVPVDSPATSGGGGYRPPVLESRQGSSLYEQQYQGPQHSSQQQQVFARQVDPTSFEISMELPDPSLTVEDAMEVIGNPSCLVLWCESVRSLVVINSSEKTTSSGRDSDSRRAGYEGEWIEASTTDLISPPSTSSCFYKTSKAMWNYVGFPSHYGTISMFVERPKGRVGLSLGPFAGDVTVAHSIVVEKLATTGALRIVDRVTLSRDGDNGLCGVLECLESCFLPTLKGYMDQAVSSMVRLRRLLREQRGGGGGQCEQREGFEFVDARHQS